VLDPATSGTVTVIDPEVSPDKIIFDIVISYS
jgi:hypothetical protein